MAADMLDHDRPASARLVKFTRRRVASPGEQRLIVSVAADHLHVGVLVRMPLEKADDLLSGAGRRKVRPIQAATVQQQMRMRIDEAGHEGAAVKVDLPRRTGRDGPARALGADCGDPALLDQDSLGWLGVAEDRAIHGADDPAAEEHRVSHGYSVLSAQ
jgi:hypothetical protein